MSAPFMEIFPSLQGEGLLAGTPQVFARLARCNLRCNYCDTPESIGEPPRMMRHSPGVGAPTDGAATEHPNPLSVESAAEMILQTAAAQPAIRGVAVTGGEPLLHVEFLLELLPLLRSAGLRILLDSGGILAPAMEKIATFVDVVSVDIKLPRQTGVPADTLAARHSAFLSATSPCEITYCKIVVTDASDDAELAAARDLVADHGRGTPTFLTPVTLVAGGPAPPTTKRLLSVAGLFAARLHDVRVLPQVHVLASWR